MKPISRLLLVGLVLAAVLAVVQPTRSPLGTDEDVILPPSVGNIPLNAPKPDDLRPPGAGFPVNVSHLVGNEAEVFVDVNPTDPDNLAILGHSPGLQVINSFYTLDGGQSWTLVALGNTDDGLDGWLRGDPLVAFDRNGDVYLAYGVRQRSPNRVTVVVAKSVDGGQSYAQITHVTTNVDIGNYPGNDKWHLATGPDPFDPAAEIVYIAWTQNIDEGGSIDQRIVVAQSADGGATFSSPVIVNDASVNGTSLSNTYVDPAVGPNGELYVEWYNIIERRIYVDYSPGNLVFGTDVVVSTSDIGSGASIPAQPSRGVYAGPSIDTDRSGGVHDGRLYTVYADIGPGGLPDVDVYVRYSDDQAATWSPRSLVNDDGGTSSQFLPILAVDQVLGIVGVSFYDTRNDPSNGRAEMRVAASYDGGVTFAENLTLSSGPSDQSAGNPSAWIGNYLDYIGLAIHNGVASGVWSDNSTDPADLDLFFGRVSLLDPASTPEEEGFATGPVRDGDHESRLSGASVSPNPVSDQTQLSFDLAIPMRVRVGVFDVSGRAVRVLVDEERPAGRQSVVWDRRDAQGRDASPGTYFYRIEVPGQQLQGKVIVVG